MFKTVKSFYDSYWLNESSRSKLLLRFIICKKAIDYSIELCGDLKNKKFLEIGMGLGNQALNFVKKGVKYYGMDISDTSINFVKSKFKEAKLKGYFLKGNSEDLSIFKKNSFDVVYFNSLIMHTDHDKTIKEINRILKEGGILIFLEPMNLNPFFNIYRLIFSKFKCIKPNYFKYNEIKKYSNLFSSVIHKEFYLFSVGLFPLHSFFNNKERYLLIINFLEKFDRILIKAFPFLRRFCWFTVVKFVK